MEQQLHGKKDVVVIGGGFIGVEVADELAKSGHQVTIVEKMPHILAVAFDEEFSQKAEEILTQRGITLKTGVGVKELKGNGSVDRAELEDGTSIKVEAVVLSMGYSPNTKLAAQSDIPLNDKGFIKVDEYMRTSLLSRLPK